SGSEKQNPYSYSLSPPPERWTTNPFVQKCMPSSSVDNCKITPASTGNLNPDENFTPPGLISIILTLACLDTVCLPPTRIILIIPDSGTSGLILRNFLVNSFSSTIPP